MASVLTNAAKKNVLQAWVDNATDIRMMLLDDNHSNNIDSHEFIDDVNGNEISGTGYTEGGQSVTGVTVNQDNTNDRAELDFDNVVWDATGGSISAAYAVLYDDTGGTSTSQILAIFDFGGTQTANNDTFTLSPDSEGAVQIS